jgi:hypothetical protein
VTPFASSSIAPFLVVTVARDRDRDRDRTCMVVLRQEDGTYVAEPVLADAATDED